MNKKNKNSNDEKLLPGRDTYSFGIWPKGSKSTATHRIMKLLGLYKGIYLEKKDYEHQQLSIQNTKSYKKPSSGVHQSYKNFNYDEEVKKFLSNISYYNYKNNKYLSEKNNKRLQSLLLHLLQHKVFLNDMFEGGKAQKFIDHLKNRISDNITMDLSRLEPLIHKFSPQQDKNIPQSKIYNPQETSSMLLFSFIENLYFCEFVTQCFNGSDNTNTNTNTNTITNTNTNTNTITINNNNYNIYYSTLFEDRKGIDIVLSDGKDIIGVDITTHNKPGSGFKHKVGYDIVKIFKYNQSFRILFIEFINRYNSHIIKGTLQPQIDHNNPIVQKFKGLFSSFIKNITLRNNAFPADPTKDNNDEKDL